MKFTFKSYILLCVIFGVFTVIHLPSDEGENHFYPEVIDEVYGSLFCPKAIRSDLQHALTETRLAFIYNLLWYTQCVRVESFYSLYNDSRYQ